MGLALLLFFYLTRVLEARRHAWNDDGEGGFCVLLR